MCTDLPSVTCGYTLLCYGRPEPAAASGEQNGFPVGSSTLEAWESVQTVENIVFSPPSLWFGELEKGLSQDCGCLVVRVPTSLLFCIRERSLDKGSVTWALGEIRLA